MPSSPPTTLLLVRHGENDWVSSKKLAGRTPGVHLNDKGQGQARRLAARLAAWPLAAIYSSPLERCRETAEIVAAPHRLPVLIHQGVLEADYGDWQGQSFETLTKEPLWRVIQSTPSFAQFPGGETMRGMQQRMVDALHEIADRHTGQVVCVCSHADPIKAALAHFLGSHFDLFQRIHISTGSASVLLLGEHGPRVLRLNDTGHLPPPPPIEAEQPVPPPASGEDTDHD